MENLEKSTESKYRVDYQFLKLTRMNYLSVSQTSACAVRPFILHVSQEKRRKVRQKSENISKISVLGQAVRVRVGGQTVAV